MTDVQSCCESENIVTTTTITKEIKLDEKYYGDDSSATSSFLLKAPTANSKLILQNMEDVLNSVKKKHRQKHRRKKEQKKLAQMAEAELAASRGLIGNEEGEKTLEKPNTDAKRKSHKKPLQEKSARENGKLSQDNGTVNRKIKHKSRKSPLKCSTPVAENASITKHFQRTPKKDEAVTTPKPANVFELMMNARSKSIGTNTNGKEPSISPTAANIEESTINVKRKLMLQEWADRKGGAKRKLDEESRAAYVEHQLEKRAKRLKKMLTKPDELKKSDQKKPTQIQSNTSPDTTAPVKRGRGRPRTRRLSTLDSNVSVEVVIHDEETIKFLENLNSPTKKRDSLLGYFPKKESPPNLKMVSTDSLQANTKTIEKELVETPKRQQKRTTIKNIAAEVFQPDLIVDSPAITVTPNVRPKRSCAGKSKYDYDLEPSPTKEARIEKSNTSNLRKQNISIEIIELDNSNAETETTPTTLQTPKKLAPLFVRQMPKPSPDPIVLKARQEFLRSGVPEKLKQEQTKQKQFEQCFEEAYEYFPKVSHVLQLTPEELIDSQQTIHCSWKLLPCAVETNDRTQQSNKRYKTKSQAIGVLTTCTVANHRQQKAKTLQANVPLITVDNKRHIIKTWKAEFDRFPTYKCYNQLREKYRYFSAIDSAQDTQQVSESLVVTCRTRRSLEAHRNFDPEAEEEKPPATAPNGELLFTEKYKPLLFEQVLVNLTPIQQLRDFLSSWSIGTANASNRNSQTNDDSLDFTNDSNSMSTNSNTMVLLGPSSSGKTSAVFALAHDMNFNVLEINAGMKRTGKKLIQELQEATQSHQIRKDKSKTTTKQLLKMSLNAGMKVKRQNSQTNELLEQSSDQSASEICQNARKSLILIEDADIVFEQTDAGFTDAIYTLAASSKRPIILVATNPNCAHLQRLMQQNIIQFMPANVLNISKYLSVLSLIENCPIHQDELISLYLYNKKNLRKTLLEMQFFIQSGGDRHLQSTKHINSPKKKGDQQKAAAPTDCAFFASPSKRRFSEDPNVVQEQQELMDDSKRTNEKQINRKKPIDELYMHRALFEYYTCAQNEEWRIPFPVDFQLLPINLTDILQVSKKLQALPTANSSKHNSSTPATKRKSRSPKKAWLNSATNGNQSQAPMDVLCDFYENLSIATQLATRNAHHFEDRLLPHLSEQIAHSLVEQSIKVNLDASACPYNLFDTPNECNTLCDKLGSTYLRTSRMRSLDFEPALRQICRSEKERATLERRSSRFYHYLRNQTINLCNFSVEPYDNACTVFEAQEEQQHEDTT